MFYSSYLLEMRFFIDGNNIVTMSKFHALLNVKNKFIQTQNTQNNNEI